jgi:hypothetical protein
MSAGLLFGLNAALNLILMLALARVMPADAYGSLATWTAGALFLATAVFDWIRFSAMRFRTAPLVQAALVALALDVVGLFAFKAHGLAGAMTAHLMGLFGGAALLLGRALIGLRVRWPLADTVKIACAGAAMAGSGWLVAGRVQSAFLAAAAAGAAMAGVFALSAWALDIAGVRGLNARIGASARSARRTPLGREETEAT